MRPIKPHIWAQNAFCPQMRADTVALPRPVGREGSVSPSKVFCGNIKDGYQSNASTKGVSPALVVITSLSFSTVRRISGVS